MACLHILATKLALADFFCRLVEHGGNNEISVILLFLLSLLHSLQNYTYSFHKLLEIYCILVQTSIQTKPQTSKIAPAIYHITVCSMSLPGALKELKKNGISVRRNTINIGQSIDGAGEQTFMRSARTTGQ